MKPGIQTTEFWITALTNIALAIVGVLAARGLLSVEEGQLWVALVNAVLVAVVPLAMALITNGYVKSRMEVKTKNGK